MVDINYSFAEAYKNITIANAQIVKEAIMARLGMKSNTEFYIRKKSWKNIPYHAYIIIEEEFNKVGYIGAVFKIEYL